MKLLPKSEIIKKQNDARKMQIDEGQRIARKIDILRETLANEELSLEKFRKETVTLIHKEVSEERAILNSLKKEIEDLSIIKKELQKPLDEEWEKVKEAMIEIEKHKEAINVSWNDILKREQEIKETSKKTAQTLANTLRLEERTKDELTEAHSKNIEAEKALKLSKEKLAKTEVYIETTESEIRDREKELASREKDCTIRETKLLKQQSELEKGWKLLNDRKESFDRTIKRLKR